MGNWKFALPLLIMIVLSASIVSAASLTDIIGHWAEDDVRELVDLGAITGYPDGTYRPQNTITRAEFSSVLRGALGLPEVPGQTFDDILGHWAEGRIEALIQAGIIEPMLYPDTYSPNGAITREEIAMMTVRMLGQLTGASDIPFTDADAVSPGYHTYVAEAYARGIVTGYPDTTFRPNGTATRAEAAVMAIRALRILVSEPPHISFFTADFTALIIGKGTDLHWEVEGATEITIEPDIGPVMPSGSTWVSPSTTTTYTLTASNQAGSTELDIEISVSSMTIIWRPGIIILPPNITSFSSDKSHLTQGLGATLTWEVSGLAEVTIEPGIGKVGPSGSVTVAPFTTTTYTITASNVSGEVTETASITVLPVWVSQGPWVVDRCWLLSPFKDGPKDRLWVGIQSDGSFYESAVMFPDLKYMPEDAVIHSARLELYQYETRYNYSALIGVHVVTNSWEDSTRWAVSEIVPESITMVSPGSRWVSFEVTQMVQDWVNGTKPNYGMLLAPASPLGQTTRFYGSSYPDGPLRPRLVIEYYLP